MLTTNKELGEAEAKLSADMTDDHKNIEVLVD